MKSIHHSFDTELAALYGVHAAILIHNFQHWISFNQRLKRNFHEGRTWTYQTRQEIMAHFPYLSEKEIRGALDRLVKMKVIVKGNFNKTPFDRTTWYAFENESEFLNKLYDGPKGPMETAKGPIREAQKGRPIPNTKTDTETSSSSPTSSYTKEEEEYFVQRMKEIPKKPKFISPAYKEKVITQFRGQSNLQAKHREQAKPYDGQLINGDRVCVLKDRVEFSSGNSCRIVHFDLPDETWRAQTKIWFKHEN